ncbi:hypothetical protein PX699_25135 [Sphingobium sp. H39-3-25]|uniref:hypothetical protein n=1 Tax=Sphingobium arseniciresistens TaxID=3030834 RepID=UPI0023B94AFF|nr:hypothetical protein [Sphingobium arseniciresistens]
MDLGFSLTLQLAADEIPLAEVAHAMELDVVLAAAAARQASSPTAHEMALILRGQEGGEDKVQTLANMFAPRVGGVMGAACLSGSFNPIVAEVVTVGKCDERAIYLGDLADVQGSGR